METSSRPVRKIGRYFSRGLIGSLLIVTAIEARARFGYSATLSRLQTDLRADEEGRPLKLADARACFHFAPAQHENAGGKNRSIIVSWYSLFKNYAIHLSLNEDECVVALDSGEIAENLQRASETAEQARPVASLGQFARFRDYSAAEQAFQRIRLTDRHEFDSEALRLARERFAESPRVPLSAQSSATTSAEIAQRQRAWSRRLYVESYKKHGARNPRWDEAALQFLAAAADALAGEELNHKTAPGLVAPGLRVIELGCDDPLVNYVCGTLYAWFDLAKKDEMLRQAFDCFADSNYPLETILTATLPLATHKYWAYLLYSYRRKGVDANAFHIPAPDLDPEARRHLLQACLHNGAWDDYEGTREFLQAVYGVEGFDEWLKLMLTARYFDLLASGRIDLELHQPWIRKGVRRRRGFAEKAELQHRHAWSGQAYYLDAWKLEPDLPEAALGILKAANRRYELMVVGVGEGSTAIELRNREFEPAGSPKQTLAERCRFWFDQIARVQFDDLSAYHQLMLAIRTEGQQPAVLDELISLGNECLDTGRFDTEVPRFYLQTLAAVKARTKSDDVYCRPGVYDRCQQLIGGYTGRAQTQDERNSLKSLLVCFSVLSQQPNSETQRLLSELGDQADAAILASYRLRLPVVKRLAFDPNRYRSQLPDHRFGEALRIQVDAGGRWIATGDRREGVVIWRPADGWKAAHVFAPPDELAVYDFDVSADGTKLAIVGGTPPRSEWEKRESGASSEGFVQVWEVPSGQIVQRLSGHRLIVNCVRFSPDGRMLATGGDDQRVILWDIEQGQPYSWGELKGHTDEISSLDFSQDGKWLATAQKLSGQGLRRKVVSLKLWGLPEDRQATGIRLASEPPDWEVQHFGEPVVRFSRDGTSLLILDSRNASVFGIESRKKTLEASSRSAAFSSDGNQLLTLHNDRIKIWNPGTNRLPLEFPTFLAATWTALTPLPDGRHFIAVDTRDGRIVVWDTSAGKEAESLPDRF